MSEIRVEFLIPTKYNDDSLVEDEKLMQTYDEIVERFTSCSLNNSTVNGRWMDEETKVYYNDTSRSIWIICENNEENRIFFNEFKTKLLERFKQKEILMFETPVSRF